MQRRLSGGTGFVKQIRRRGCLDLRGKGAHSVFAAALLSTAEAPGKYETFVTMTNLNLKGRWNEIKGKMKQKYGELTDDDLTFTEGKEDELLGRLQQRLGRSKEDLRKEIEQF